MVDITPLLPTQIVKAVTYLFSVKARKSKLQKPPKSSLVKKELSKSDEQSSQHIDEIV
ncbi:hypothetical protein [Methylomonas sp. AM2-LC]|uniref:hypothetical protein n=1 Tax=Methylomonas sp. AM2-LC TaxID=3153301 RepID=UPI003266A7C5